MAGKKSNSVIMAKILLFVVYVLLILVK